MSAWPTAALGEVATIERSAVQPSQIRTGTIYVGLENIGSGGTFLNPEPVDAGILASSKFQFSERHVLYGKLRPYLGKIACPDFSGICSTDILPILVSPRIDRRFLCHFLRQPTMVDYASSRAVGANLPRLSPSVLAKIEIPLPPLEEQRRIAEVLDRAEELRAKRRAAVAQLDTLTQAIFLDLFGNPANSGRWVNKLLKEVARVSSGAGFPLEYQGEKDGQFPFFKVGDMNTPGNEMAMINHQHAINEDVRLKLRAEAFPPGSIVFPKIGAAIATNKKRRIIRPSCIDNNVMAVIPGDALDSKYFFCLLGLKNLSDFAQRGNPPSMRKTDVESWAIPVPDISLQRDFRGRAEAVDGLKATHAASLAALDALFASLQHRAFRGEL